MPGSIKILVVIGLTLLPWAGLPYSHGATCQELVAEGVPTYADVKPVVETKCAVCHQGPFLDFSSYPFFSDKFGTMELLMKEVVRRIELKGWGRMPPANGKPLSDSELDLLKRWYQGGLQ